MRIRKNIRNIMIAVAILALVLLAVCSSRVFHMKLSSILIKSSVRSVSDMQGLYIQTLQAKFADQMDMLEAQARYFDGIDLSDDAALKKAIASTRGIGEFKKIAVANKEGACTSYTGQSLANIYNKSYFFDTLKTGKPQISNRIEVDENLEPILSLTYPIMRGNSVGAVIVGTLSYTALKNLFTSSLFSGEGYMYIITADGNVILSNRDQNRTLYNVNIYDLIRNNSDTDNSPVIEKMKSDIIKNYSEAMRLGDKDGGKLFTYAPIGINNWYIVSVLPYSFIVRQQSAISLLLYVYLGINAFTVLMFIFVVSVLFRMTFTVEKDNERLITANNQSQSLIFEYDLQKGEVVFSGDTQFILGTDKKTFPVDFIKAEYYKRIHRDDLSVMDFLHDSLRKPGADFSGEFRYKTFSGEYIWLRISGSLIAKGETRGSKFIGTINNVNAQVMHEQELKSIAEVDKLTGLLNKSAMEQKARQFLGSDLGGQRCALFIIDLDNFKKVNDSLGHLVGDMAIMDAGKKLSLIFSEKDFISRFGGDEFCILLRMNRNFDDETAVRIITEKAQNMCTFLREDYFDDKTIVGVSASIGIAMYPDDGKSYQELFQRADEALYKVKFGGKNGFKMYGKD